MAHTWMVQAAHIFSSLDIQTNREDYVFLRSVQSIMHFSGSLDHLPPGYLFLCSPDQFAIDPRSDCPAYWSLDPSGAARLTPEEAARLGFPEFLVDVKIRGLFFTDEVYAGMREFHAAKGYDPDTLGLVKDLGYPLCEIACEEEELHAYRRNFGRENVGRDYESQSRSWIVRLMKRAQSLKKRMLSSTMARIGVRPTGSTRRK
ncbi:hypothetical protein FB45DRAFT_368112 [Roridomyces roridus]|uniref:Uncharacterized protein n=1 Tax=Roridomyces roridus TaxID=1738132 RepID=A0AAD7F8V4_9AGAR|nr:hypothetical protein FB45DRAFT_368112 [Roridomyces roridus]